MRQPINPHDAAGCSARRVSQSFTANRSGDAWAVYQDITWKTPDGDWDGSCIRLADGLTEAEAQAEAAALAGQRVAA